MSAEELSALTVAQLRALAEDMGIHLTKIRKADIIAEILTGAEGIEIPAGEEGADSGELPDPGMAGG